MPSDRVAFSGSFVPSTKSKFEKLDVIVDVVPADDEVVVVDDDVAAPLLSRVVVDPVDVPVDVEPVERMVAAPAAMTQRSDTPAPIMEPVNLIFIFATPVVSPLSVLQ
ncbi:hypothetical protein K663_09300 [Sphingobium sp. MI1205]|nr:hypothetical protein K663_09300 [Sphingobium sp. MI1205]